MEEQKTVELTKFETVKRFNLDTEKYLTILKEVKPINYLYYGSGAILTIFSLFIAHFLSNLFLLGDLFSLTGFIWIVSFTVKNLLYVESRKKLNTMFTTYLKKITG